MNTKKPNSSHNLLIPKNTNRNSLQSQKLQKQH
jgi:hypothetical protein